LQHLERTLLQNIADNFDYENCKFLVLAYGDQSVIEYAKTCFAKSCFPWDIGHGKLVVYELPGEDIPFRMAHAKNMAHRLGILEGADILVNLDADNFTGPGFAAYIAEQFESSKEDLVLWTKWNLPGMEEGTRIPKGCGGRIVVSRNAFLKVGGYDEKYDTWGPDDKDFNARLRRLGILPRQIDQQYLKGILHNDKMRFKQYPEARTTMDSSQFELVHETDATIANFGNFGCGKVAKLYRGSLDSYSWMFPLPTRIFGIGMHKTATTSLHSALKILGYDSMHWKNAHWAKAIWNEMKAGRSLTLERSYALSDLPIPLLYRELDKAYPGSQFILTTKWEDRWLKSVEKHWSREHNRFRQNWDTDPFTHKIHTELYGRRNFDADIFLARYRRHNSEVFEYFRNRPGDLLVMDMDANAGWGELCPFLNQPIPAVDYPKVFVTKSGFPHAQQNRSRRQNVPPNTETKGDITMETKKEKKERIPAATEYNARDLATYAQARELVTYLNKTIPTAVASVLPGDDSQSPGKLSAPTGIYLPIWFGSVEPAAIDPAGDEYFYLELHWQSGAYGVNVGLVINEFSKYPASPGYVVGWLLGNIKGAPSTSGIPIG
jgi:hypothetical protein